MSKNMENLELLSDDELRIKLLQFGFPNLPITQTTRKTLIKKLRNHIAGANETLRKSTSLVTRYSSGEDSDSIDSGNKWKKKSRITISGSPGVQMPPPKSYSQPQPTNHSRASQHKSSPQVLPRATYSPSSSKKSSVYVSPVIINDSENEDTSWKGINSQPTYTTRNSSFNHSTRDYGNSNDSSPYKNGNNGYDEDDGDDSTSETTKRLLQFRQHIPAISNHQNNFRKRTIYSNPRDVVYQADTTLDSSTHKSLRNRIDFKQTFVPMFLVTLVVVFFALVIFCYFQISPNIQTILTPSTTSYVPCDSLHDDQQVQGAAQNCIEESSLDSALRLLKTIAPEMQNRAIGYRCGDKSAQSPYVCVREFGRLITDSQNFMNILEDTKNIEYLVDRNKQWGISNVDNKGQVLSLEQVTDLQPQQLECFGVLDPKLPLTCRIKNKIHTYFTIIGSLAVVGFVAFAVWKFYSHLLMMKKRKSENMDQIIRKICAELKDRAALEGSSVVVNHLRDKIIDPSKRTELASAWTDAIAYLEQNDSRVHFGVENINGEDFKIMRWIDEVKMNPGDQNSKRNSATPKKYQETPTQHFATTKKWMGSAFDKSNKIKDPPTNCLKIRNMFDKFEASNQNLRTIIQDTILYKLKDRNCKLYDLQLDLKSCCVYVKCANCTDAGVVHEETNGWWLETEIVVVKFLKQEKYHLRFPDSVHANSPLHPSSNVFITKNDVGTNGHDDYYDDGDDDYD